MTSRLFGEPYHFTHEYHDFGEGQSAALLRNDLRSYGQPQRIYECEEACVIGPAELVWKSGDSTWGFFHERLGGRKGVASSAGYCLAFRQIENAGWWKLPAHDQLQNLIKSNAFVTH